MSARAPLRGTHALWVPCCALMLLLAGCGTTCRCRYLDGGQGAVDVDAGP